MVSSWMHLCTPCEIWIFIVFPATHLPNPLHCNYQLNSIPLKMEWTKLTKTVKSKPNAISHLLLSIFCQRWLTIRFVLCVLPLKKFSYKSSWGRSTTTHITGTYCCMKFVEYIGPHYYNDATTLVSVGIFYTNKSNMATILHLRLYTRTIRLEHVMQIAYFMPKEADFTIPKSNCGYFQWCVPWKRALGQFAQILAPQKSNIQNLSDWYFGISLCARVCVWEVERRGQHILWHIQHSIAGAHIGTYNSWLYICRVWRFSLSLLSCLGGERVCNTCANETNG